MFRNMRRTPLFLLSLSALAAGTAARVDAASLNGEPLTVTLQESGFPDATDTITAGPGGPQIVWNGTDPIASTGALISPESVDVQDLQIVYNIAGGGGQYTGSDPGCSGGCTLWGSMADDARFLFSNLDFGSPGTILEGVSLTTSNVFGVQVADVTDNSFEVIFGSAGIVSHNDGTQDLGTITLDLQTEVAPVPLPSSLVMLVGGLLFVGWAGLRRRTYSTSVHS